MAQVNFVTTISGKEVLRKDCIKIGDYFFEKNVDCFNIDGKWYRKGNPKIYFNNELQRYLKTTENTTIGIVEYKQDYNKYVFGRFEKDKSIDIKIQTYGNGNVSVINMNVFDSIPKIYIGNRGEYFDYKAAMYSGYDLSRKTYHNKYYYSFERVYNSDKIISLFKDINNSKYTKAKFDYNNWFDLLDKYSFGFEFETSSGLIPEFTCKQLGLIPLRDGSINGHEYTTIPMQGKDGVNLLLNQLDELNDKCLIDKECSVHLHLGGFPLDKCKIMNLYNILVDIQDDLSSIMPRSIFNTAEYKSHGKDYCKRLPDDLQFEEFDKLYEYLSGEDGFEFNGFYDPHPSDPDRNRKWEINRRYYAINFINLLFGNGGKTVEFRMHNATLNKYKIINWLFICMSILKYAEEVEYKQGVKTSLEDIILVTNGQESVYLLDYINERSTYFTRCNNLFNDNYGYFDLIEDSKQIFKTPLILY